MSSPLMPSLVDQPFLQGVEMNFVITAPKARDVSLESRFVEPSKHLIKLLAQNESNHRHRQLAELDRLPKDTAETRAASGLVNSLPAISISAPMKSLPRSNASAT